MEPKQELKAGTEAGTMGKKMLFTGWFSLARKLPFLYCPGLGMALPRVAWLLLHQVAVKKRYPTTVLTDQSEEGNSSDEGTSS